LQADANDGYPIVFIYTQKVLSIKKSEIDLPYALSSQEQVPTRNAGTMLVY